MRYVSTRGGAPPVAFSQAILHGLAPDGGLYVPEDFPHIDTDRVARAEGLAARAAEFLRPFLAGDLLETEIDAVCAEAFDFALPLVAMPRDTALLELFHGPTAAFKDFGARFLAVCFQRLLARGRVAPGLAILVATSGDTGAAVAAACHRRANLRVGVLFPRDGVSPRQAHQLTCWDDNVRSFAVRGSFDDCQRLVKAAFRDPVWQADGPLSSANSINIGRLLPQAAYYAIAAQDYLARRGRVAGFIVPSGNIGNAVGAFWARRLEFPLGRIALATNANRVVPDWFATGRWEPRASVATLANAMDVGDPSNMERVFHLYPSREALLRGATTGSVDDATIRATIAAGPERWGQVFCPHTATAVALREQVGEGDWVVVATAHPAKFETIVEPLIGRRVEPPPALTALLARPTRVDELEPDLGALRAQWQAA